MSSTTIHLSSGQGRFAPTAREALRQAAAVRELAQTYVRTDRGFADDLFAAADRHERLYADSSSEE